MRGILGFSLCAALIASAVQAAPLVPRITSHDFTFGASEPSDTPFYDPRGADADFLTLEADPLDREVTAFWEVWPAGSPLSVLNSAGEFGGDLEVYLEFDAEDSSTAGLDVSLTGRGRNANGSDIRVWGAIPDAGIADFSLLLEIEVDSASLYGFAGQSSFVLETAGTIVGVDSRLPGAGDILGQSAVSRGNIDFRSISLPAAYDPLAFTNTGPDGGGYSGEVGRGFPTPEPASLALLLLGAAVSLRRRH